MIVSWNSVCSDYIFVSSIHMCDIDYQLAVNKRVKILVLEVVTPHGFVNG
jgi:hypothetical protein